MTPPMRVIVAGGGVAGLEGVLALSVLAGELAEVELLSPSDEFLYRPMLVAEPFGSAEALKIDVGQVAEAAGARHSREELASVDPARHQVATASGTTLEYDALLVATGATPVEAVPGAVTFATQAGREAFAGILEELGRRSMRHLAFVVPPAANWSIAAYELALLTAAECRARRLQNVALSLVTYEAAPLDIFGSSASELVGARLEEAGVSIRKGARAQRFEDGRLHLHGAETLAVDAAVALPGLEVAEIPGLPQRRGGFVPTDTTMQVAGLETVWAAGDATWFPIKQGGLAAQQADAAARAIAVRAGAHVPIEPFQPVLRGALITGDAPDFLRARIGGDGTIAPGRPLWSPATKIAGKYLAPYLADRNESELQDVDPSAGHSRDHAVSLILAAADADARIGDFESAIKWLSLVEELDFVIPAEYVARRHGWRKQLHPDLPADAAAARIDPSFASSAAALSDLQRRMGWLREIEHRNEGEMRDHLAALDQGMEHLLSLSRQTGTLPAERQADGD